MKVLLDTHVIIWISMRPENLSPTTAKIITKQEKNLWISPISIWEILLLIEKGKLQNDSEPVRWTKELIKGLKTKEAVLNSEIAYLSRQLDGMNQDPADRFIIATAMHYDMTLVTADSHILRLGVCKTMKANA